MSKQIVSVFTFIFLNYFGYTQVINEQALKGLLQKAEETHSEAVIVYQDNKLIAEKYFGIGKAETKIEAMSATKSIVGLAIACLLTDKMLDSLDVPVCRYYPEWRQGQKQYITVRHLLNHTSGIQNVPNTSSEIYPSPDFIQLALAAELTDKPGTVFSYNNKSVNLLAGVIQKITHKRMDLFIGERLFKPLGITNFSWTLDSAGNPHAMSGCQLLPSDFIKLGQLLLDKGKYKGTPIISEKYINDIITPCKQFDGYGLLWWIDYDETLSTVDEASIQKLKDAGVDNNFVVKAIQLKGSYTSDEEYIAQIEKIFGKDPWNYINGILSPKNLKLRKKEYKGSTTYRADGYLGNYIIIVPNKKLVAIRMISSNSYTSKNDSFSDFEKMVKKLVE